MSSSFTTIILSRFILALREIYYTDAEDECLGDYLTLPRSESHTISITSLVLSRPSAHSQQHSSRTISVAAVQSRPLLRKSFSRSSNERVSNSSGSVMYSCNIQRR